MAIITCGPKCTHEDKTGFKGCGDPQLTYVGAVLSTYERNGYDDSDFYAIVWDDETQSLRHVMYATTRGWTYHNGAKVDATPEALERATEALAETLGRVMLGQARKDATEPLKGRTVRSLMTRGKSVGLVGEVKWYGPDKYAVTKYGVPAPMKVGVRVKGEPKLRYLPADRVEVLNPEPVDEEQIRSEAQSLARSRAQGGHWRLY